MEKAGEAEIGAESTTLVGIRLSMPHSVYVNLLQALVRTCTSSRDVWKTFWSAQQRFFKLLCVSMKVRLHAAALCVRSLYGQQPPISLAAASTGLETWMLPPRATP